MAGVFVILPATLPTIFLLLMLIAMAKTLVQALVRKPPVNASVYSPVNIAGLKTLKPIMLLLQDNPHLTRQQLDNLVGKVP
ncbi:hypothetical protein [Rheinheimera sp. UJ63]|uniref:hypothetical protein n=1 Tax=Rheinheimera sp. UJ63 TaxID=2910157 RepID=UPI001F218A23|nr:hypothetical protein [Rheinheimera sp. UJ63]MCF4008532.1 hypothetical protein [Rheinheimera sp. UJ63]